MWSALFKLTYVISRIGVIGVICVIGVIDVIGVIKLCKGPPFFFLRLLVPSLFEN